MAKAILWASNTLQFGRSVSSSVGRLYSANEQLPALGRGDGEMFEMDFPAVLKGDLVTL